ncbi:MAG TPA: cation diffusion facilitator family transporter [Planosporangium sp.]|nr:cation diffusion facilitator family transporter [Planosporangium sp.]
MGHGHQHGAVTPASARHRGRLLVTLGLLSTLALVEVVVGLTTGSLALLSDAGHVAVDVFGLAMTLAAVSAASRPSRSAHRTFGLYRVEVVVTLANAALLAGVAGWVLVEAVGRLGHPVDVAPVPLTLTALAALAVNGAAYALLHRGATEALSLRGASTEVLADGIAALGALVAGVVIWLTGWRYADPLVAIGVAILIVPRAVGLGRAALRVLLEAAPPGVDVAEVATALGALPGVLEVHDLHVWTLTSGMEAATAHLTVTQDAKTPAVLAGARTILSGKGVDHATLQLEPADSPDCCHNARW